MTATAATADRLQVDTVRADFPALHQEVYGKPLVYLDNAATTQKPKAVIEAGVIRLRPVFLTAVTTVLGLIPLTIGLNIDFFNRIIQTGVESSQWWGPMGVAVIFGLTVATVLTLVIVPVTYHSLDDMSGALQTLPSRLGFGRREKLAASPKSASPAEG